MTVSELSEKWGLNPCPGRPDKAGHRRIYGGSFKLGYGKGQRGGRMDNRHGQY